MATRKQSMLKRWMRRSAVTLAGLLWVCSFVDATWVSRGGKWSIATRAGSLIISEALSGYTFRQSSVRECFLGDAVGLLLREWFNVSVGTWRWQAEWLPTVKTETWRTGQPYAWRLVVPTYILIMSLAFVGFRNLALTLRRSRRRKAGQCPSCGYDVRHSGSVCPECGNEDLPT